MTNAARAHVHASATAASCSAASCARRYGLVRPRELERTLEDWRRGSAARRDAVELALDGRARRPAEARVTPMRGDRGSCARHRLTSHRRVRYARMSECARAISQPPSRVDASSRRRVKPIGSRSEIFARARVELEVVLARERSAHHRLRARRARELAERERRSYSPSSCRASGPADRPESASWRRLSRKLATWREGRASQATGSSDR